MWISVGIAITKIGSIWAKNMVVRNAFRTGTSLFIMLSVIQSRNLRKANDEANIVPNPGEGQAGGMGGSSDDDVPF